MEKNGREFEIDTRRKRIERDEGNSVVQLRSPPFSVVRRRSPPFMLRSPFMSPSREERARTVTVK